MKRQDDNEKALELLHELPPEVSLEQVDKMVAAFPLAVGVTAALVSFFKYNLNSILMTSTAGTILVGGSMYFFSAAEPAPEQAALPEPVPVVIAAIDAPVNLDGPAVVLELKPEKQPVEERVVAPIIEHKSDTVEPETLPEPEPELLATISPGPMAKAEPAVVMRMKEGERAFDFSGFHSIALLSSVDVLVEQGEFSVKAVGEEEGLERLKITTGNGTLRIEQGSMKSNASHCRVGTVVMVRMPQVRKLEVIGSGSINASEFANAEHLTLVVKGSGDVIMKGLEQAQALSIELDGSGDVVCGDANVAGPTVIALAGSGDVRVAGSTDMIDIGLVGSGDVVATDMRASNAKVRVVGSGDVHLSRTGSLDQQVTGSGEVHVSGRADGDGPRGVGARTY